MAEMRVDLSGKKGVAALVAVAVLVALRLTGFQNVTDEEVRRQLREALLPEVAEARVARMRELVEAGSAVGEEIEALSQGPEVRFHQVKLSRPLLSWSNRQEVVVYVDYEILGVEGRGGREQRYLLFRTRAGGRWEYRHDTGYITYLLNF